MPRPVILGVVGDSAAGKTTITRGLVRILGEEQVTHVCTDDYHRYDRKQRADLGITPLHPDCNYIDIAGQHLEHLREGEAILKPVYRHADGTFGAPVHVKPHVFTVVEGLLGYHTPAMRECYDVRVYLAPPEDLRRKWKVQRDCSRRGYTTDQVLGELDRREPDSAAFIRPQERYADMVVSFMPGESGDPDFLEAEVVLREGFPIRISHRSSTTARAESPSRSAARSGICSSRATSTRSAPARSRKRSGTSSTSRRTCAASAWASSRSGSTCTARNRSRSCSY